MNHRTDGVVKLDAFAAIVETARILPGDIETGAVLSLEGSDILDNEAVVSRRQLEAAEGEVDAVGERDEIEIERLGPNVGQLDVLGVRIVGTTRIGRMIHDFADPQTLGHRPHRKDRLIQRAPGPATKHSRFDARALLQYYRAHIFRRSIRGAAILRGRALARFQRSQDNEVRTCARRVHRMNREEVLSLSKHIAVIADEEGFCRVRLVAWETSSGTRYPYHQESARMKRRSSAGQS